MSDDNCRRNLAGLWCGKSRLPRESSYYILLSSQDTGEGQIASQDTGELASLAGRISSQLTDNR